MELTQKRLKELLVYDQKTGGFTWLRARGLRKMSKDQAGSINCKGYFQICVDGKLHLTHRLAWLYMTGEWPKGKLDHVNCDPTDNRFSNLRLATDRQNAGNRKINKNNKSGIKGVHWHKYNRKWVAKIGINGKRKTLGNFDRKEDAAKAYRKAAKEYFGDFARTD